MQNLFDSLLKKISSELANSHTFIGVYTDKKGKFRILKDEQTGKYKWYSSCALIHSEFMNKLAANDPAFKGCTFYAISGVDYVDHRLTIHGYENTEAEVSHEMMLVLRPVLLEFHKKAALGLFMPVSTVLNTLTEKIKNDPSALFLVASKAKQLILEETKPCCSCGTICHIPELSDHKNITTDQMKELLYMFEKQKLFCFGCGIKFMAGTARYKIAGWTDMAKVQAMNALITKCESMDINQPNFDYDAAQNALKDMMSHITATKLTVVNGDEIKSEKITKKDILPKQSGQNPPPWMN